MDGNKEHISSLKAQGLALLRGNRLGEAKALYTQVCHTSPDDVEAWYMLSSVNGMLGDMEEAGNCCRRVIALQPDHSEAYVNLGNVLFHQGKPDEALMQYQKALKINPNHAGAYCNSGNIQKASGHADEAIESYKRAIALQPDNAVTYYNLGTLLNDRHQLKEAVDCFQRAIALKPDYAEAYNNLGLALKEQGNLNEAKRDIQHALRLKPDLPLIHNNLGNVYKLQGKLDEALACFQEALRLDPRYAAAHSNLLFVLNYHADYDAETLYAEHVRWGEMHGRNSGEFVPHGNVPDEGRRLRVGYICADFRNHPVGIFIEQVLAHHDKKRFEIFCYSNHAINDDVTVRLRRHADGWRDIVGQTDEAVARRIREDGIDILVDLAGHTAGNRLLTLALKPAPVQATWIGYIATTGLKAVDYIIGDRYVTPPQDARYYVEQVVRLPHSFLCFTPPRLPIEVSPLPALSRAAITFGCFNNTAKLTPQVIATWAKLLLHFSRSRLFLKSVGFGDELTRAHYRGLFAAHGVQTERLEFAGHSPRNEYLAAYHQVDIGLDPFPFNGGTTTVEALWMGVPVITLRGDRFVGRMGESIMTTLGLAECVAETEDAYIAKAIALASDLPRLVELRSHLRAQLLNSPLCDGPGFTRNLEAAYRNMWETWCRTRLQSDT
jgi:protein O-GlcNAc transferase